MKTITHFLNILFALAIAGPLLAADPRNINWQDLLPEERPYHDPFAALEYSQINALAMLYRIEVLNSDTADDEKRAEAVQIREDLVSQGLDPDWLFEQREIVMNQRLIAAREPNPDLLGENCVFPATSFPWILSTRRRWNFFWFRQLEPAFTHLLLRPIRWSMYDMNKASKSKNCTNPSGSAVKYGRKNGHSP